MKGADEVIYVPVRELEAESYTPNDASAYGKTSRRRKPRRSIEHPAADFYAGQEKFLVRTALIRAEGVDLSKGAVIDNAEAVAELCKHLIYADQEHLVTIALSSSGRLLAIHEVAVGHTSQTLTTVQHLIKVAFLTTASGLIMVHNHPGGDPWPSEDDAKITSRAVQACGCAGLVLMDHVIVAIDGWVSFHATDVPLGEIGDKHALTRFHREPWTS